MTELRRNLATHWVDRPDSVAVWDPQGSITFGRLRRRVGGAVAALDATGHRGPVVVLTERSIESIVAMLAVMWSGRTLVSLDAADPPERLREIIGRTGDALVVDATGTVDPVGLLDIARARVCDLGHGEAEPGAFRPLADDDVEAIIFTSGSTGRPKGVAQRVGRMNSSYREWASDPSISEAAVTAVFMPLNFLGGYLAMSRFLSVGSAIVLIDGRTASARQIADIVEMHGIQRLTMTPSLARSLAVSLAGRRFGSVDMIILSGEPTRWDDIAVIRRCLPPTALIVSVYGASEAPGVITMLAVPSELPLGSGPAPLGRPFIADNVRLDPLVPGRFELVVQNQVAEGYWNDPDQTAERFGVTDDGVRYWRSGDVVSVDDDGQLVHHGRLDEMIKVNGMLVEPSEAERVLRDIPGVRAAAVLPRRLPSGRDQIVGHVEVSDDVDVDAVWERLRAELPDHLVPAVLVRHDRLPITDRGKLDRLSMRIDAVSPWRSTAARATDDGIERAVLGIAASVLGVDDLGPDDDLFEMGCDSLAAIEIIADLVDTHSSALQPNDLLTASTVRAVAAMLGDADVIERSTVVSMPCGDTSDDATQLHLFAGAGGPALQYRPLARALGPEYAVTVYEQAGLHQRRRRDLTIGHMARRHLASLRRRQPHGPYVLAGHSMGGIVAIEVARRLRAVGEEARVVLLDAIAPPAPSTLFRGVHGEVLAALRARQLGGRLGPIGSARRYDQFFRYGSGMLRYHRIGSTDAPITLLHCADSPARDLWPGHDVTAVEVPGDHLTMIMPPAVAVTAATIDAVLRSPATASPSDTRL